MNRLIGRFTFLSILISTPVAFAEAPTQFAVPQENARVFYPVSELHKGDVLQVRSPHLLGDETLILARCTDECKGAQVVSVWRHGFHLASGLYNPVIRSNITLKQDGRYFLWLVKNSQCYVDAWGCRASAWPGVLTYGNPQALSVSKTDGSGEQFRVKFDSGSWVFVRQVPTAKAMAHSQGND